MKINIKLVDFQKEYDIQQELSINEEDLNKELAEQPGRYAFFATLFSLAEKDYNLAELEMSQIESNLDADIREREHLRTRRNLLKERSLTECIQILNGQLQRRRL